MRYKAFAEWTQEGSPKECFGFFPADLSSADADVLRYQTRMHSMCITEKGVFYVNLGGTAGVALVPKMG